MRGLIVVERVRSERRRSLRVCSVFNSGRFGVAGAGYWWLAFVLVNLRFFFLLKKFLWMVWGMFWLLGFECVQSYFDILAMCPMRRSLVALDSP